MKKIGKNAGDTTCLGKWCGYKLFYSMDKTKYRFCKKCLAKKDAVQRASSGTKVCQARID